MQSDPKDVEIVRRLLARRGEVVSGEEIAIPLGISRVALWKRIRTLKKSGINIKVVPRRGYMLDNIEHDALLPPLVLSELKTSEFGRNYHYFDVIDSTNDYALKLLGEKALHGTVVVADHQTKGRGRLSRVWYSPPGKNLYLSVIVRPFVPVSLAFRVTMFSSCAVCELLRELGMNALIKWPNDVYVSGKKISGILTEASVEASGNVKFYVVGIGINVNMAYSDFPIDIRDFATSVMIEKGEPVPRRKLFLRLMELLEKWYNICLINVEEAWMYWRRYNYTLGKRVVVDEKVTGEAIGVTPMGYLLVRLDDGKVERVVAGDLQVVD